MADDRSERDALHRQLVNMLQDHEVNYWSKKWGVSSEQLAEAVQAVGPVASMVAKHLGKEA